MPFNSPVKTESDIHVCLFWYRYVNAQASISKHSFIRGIVADGKYGIPWDQDQPRYFQDITYWNHHIYTIIFIYCYLLYRHWSCKEDSLGLVMLQDVPKLSWSTNCSFPHRLPRGADGLDASWRHGQPRSKLTCNHLLDRASLAM